jgi:hypothetical protein
MHILVSGANEEADDKTESDKGTHERRDDQFLHSANDEKVDDKPMSDATPANVQLSPILDPGNGENASNKSQPDTRPEMMKEARKRKSSRKSVTLSDNENEKTEKDTPVGRQAPTRSKTMDERVETKTEWWKESAHERLVAKGLLPSADPLSLKPKLDNVTKPALSTTCDVRAASRGRSHKALEGASRRQAETQEDAVATEWAGVSPVDIMTPKKTDAVDDQFWASFSMTDDTDVLSSDPGDKSPAQTSAGDGRFWSSLVSLGKEGSQRSFVSGSSGSSDEKPVTNGQFIASMSDIAAAMRSAKERDTAVRSSSSRRKSMSSKERSKSRSRSGSMRPKKSKEKDKEKEKKSSKKDKKEKDSSTAKESVAGPLVRRKSFSLRGSKKEEKKEKKKKKEKNDVKA